MPYWEVPRIWKTATCFIIGGGPSIKKLDLERVRRAKGYTIAVNNSYQLAPWATILYFMDGVWHDWHRKNVREFSGLVITISDRCLNKPRIKVLKRGTRNHYDPRRTHLARGGNSGHGAISVAIHFGAKRIILLGFDMKRINGQHNYHNDHKRTVPDSIYEDQYFAGFNALAEDCQGLGIEILNATPGSALPSFPIIHPDEVL